MNLCNLIFEVSCIATGLILINAERNLQSFVIEMVSQDTGVRNTGTNKQSTSVLYIGTRGAT